MMRVSTVTDAEVTRGEASGSMPRALSYGNVKGSGSLGDFSACTSSVSGCSSADISDDEGSFPGSSRSTSMRRNKSSMMLTPESIRRCASHSLMCEIAALGTLGSTTAISSAQHPRHTHGSYGWLTPLLNTGEAVAYLSLSGNHAVAVKPEQVDSVISYTVRHKQGDKLVALTPSFNYKVLGVFGDEKGRAIMVRPQNGRSSIIFAFRGVRLDTRKTDPEADARGPAFDRANFQAREPAQAAWLPKEGMAVHSGLLDHMESAWNDGLQEVFAELSRCVEQRTPFRGSDVKRIVLVGLSFGGALAELAALRAVTAHSNLAPLTHVLSFGSVPWGTPVVAAHYDDTFGRRSVQLVNSMRRGGRKPDGVGWWIARQRGGCGGNLLDMLWSGENSSTLVSEWLTQSLMQWLAPNDARVSRDRYVVFDPLVASTSENFVPLENVLACSMGKDGKTIVDPAATSHIAKLRLDHQILSTFIDGVLPEDHPFFEDYNSLHYGARYRDLLIGFLIRHREQKEAAAAERAQRQQQLKQARLASASKTPLQKAEVSLQKMPGSDPRNRMSPMNSMNSQPPLVVATAPVMAAANFIANAMGHSTEAESRPLDGPRLLGPPPLPPPPPPMITDPRAYRASTLENELNTLDPDADEFSMF